jgi:hypothetical protein
MAATPPPITDSNQADLLARLDRIDRNVTRLLEIWDEHAHLVLAFKRGGFLAARAASKRGNGAVS